MIKPMVLWVLAMILAVFIPTVVFSDTIEKDGVDGASSLVRDVLWCHVNEYPVSRIGHRPYLDKDIDSID